MPLQESASCAEADGSGQTLPGSLFRMTTERIESLKLLRYPNSRLRL